MYFQIERRVSDFLRLECREKKSVNTNLHGKQSGGNKMAKNKFSIPKSGKIIANDHEVNCKCRQSDKKWLPFYQMTGACLANKNKIEMRENWIKK